MAYNYGGRRSRGCNLCRKRKVGCGEEKPECTRCERLGKQCVYRDEVDLLFHDETAHASARAERMWLSRAFQDTSDESTDCFTVSSGCNSSRAVSPRLSSPIRSLCQSLEDVALSRFMHDFVLEKDSKLSPLGYLEFVPRLYMSSGRDSSVIPIVEAVAFANLSRRCHAPPHVAAAASARYNAALRLTSEALKDPARMLKHETLLSCYLLGMYELIVPSATTFTAWNAHSQGAMALLKLRGLQQLDEPVGLAMFRQMYASELVSALRYCHEPASFPELARLASQPAQFMIFTVISDTSKTAADFLNTVNAKGGTDTVDKAIALNALLVRTQQLEERVELIVTCLPSMFTFERSTRDKTLVSAPRWLQRALKDTRAPECFHRYLHINAANSWNWLRHCQIRLLELQILISTRLYKSWQPIHQKMKQIEAVADELNSTIVYFLACDEYGEFNTSGKIEDVRGVKCFFLLRMLASAKMAFEFVQRRGLDVSEKLGWLSDVCGFLETEVGYAVPRGADPMNFD